MNKIDLTAPFMPLGSKDGEYYFYLREEGEIFNTSVFSINNLTHMAEISYWQKRFPEGGKKNPSDHRFNRSNAMNDLMRISKKVGRFDPNKVRGNGAWQDNGRIVVNCGDFLMIDGQRMDLASFNSDFVYVKSLKKMPNPSIPLDTFEANLILNTAKAFKWIRECDPIFLSGWLMLAPISGALPIRPHVFLTGKKGMGKSTVYEDFVGKLLGELTLKGIGPSTEAGIRQKAQFSSQPLIHDEFEGMDHESIKRIGRIVEYLRSSWSETAAQTFKGTPNGISLSYNAKMGALVCGINVILPTEADRSRFTIIELQSHSEDPKQRVKDKENIDQHLSCISAELGARLFGRAVAMTEIIIKSYKVFAKVITSQLTSREGQQLGMLLAGFWVYEHDQVVTEEEARELFAKINGSLEESARFEDNISDEEECLNVLLTTKIRFFRDGEDSPTEDLIGNMLYLNDCHSSLLQHGIRVTKSGTYIVANKHTELSRIFRNTRWGSGTWPRSLARLPKAKKRAGISFGSRDLKSAGIELFCAEKNSGSSQIRENHLKVVEPAV